MAKEIKQYQCEACSHTQDGDFKYCPACGVKCDGNPWKPSPSFVDVLKVAAEKQQPCMWDNVKPGTPMLMVCPCPKCSPQCR